MPGASKPQVFMLSLSVPVTFLVLYGISWITLINNTHLVSSTSHQKVIEVAEKV